MSNKAPCKDCPDRHPMCHGECEKYLAFRKARDEMLEQKLKQKRLEMDLIQTSRHFKKQKRRRAYGDRCGNH